MKKTSVRPFGLPDKLGYMLGDLGNDFTFLFSGMFMMKFYTDVMGISSGVVGVLMMLSRFIDAFTDVTMGRIVDRSRGTRAGKFRPWILYICGPVAVASFLIFQSSLANQPLLVKTVWMFVTYILWGSVFYTAVNIPYGSMASAISDDPDDRAGLSTFRTIGSVLAGLVIGTGVPLVAYVTVDGKQVLSGPRMTAVAGVLSVLAVVCYLLCYFMVKERVTVSSAAEKAKPGQLFHTVFKNRALLAVILAAILLLFSQLTMSTMNNYVYPNYYGSVWAISLMSLLGSVASLVICAPLAVPISRKFGRKELGVAACLVSSAVYIAAFFLQPENVWVFLLLGIIAQIGMGFFNMVIWAYITDVIDDAELRFGRREDGTIYSVYSFARKLGQAAASGLTGLLLDVVGYSNETAFDPPVLQGIFDIACGVPAVGFLLTALALLFLYPLNKRRVEENAALLRARRTLPPDGVDPLG